MPPTISLGCAGVGSPPVLLGSGLSWAAMCGAHRQGREAQSPGWTVYLHGRVSLHSRVSLAWDTLDIGPLSPLLLSPSGIPSARSCTWPRAAGFWELFRGEVCITGVVIYKLGAFPGTRPSCSSRGKNEWQRSPKKAWKALLWRGVHYCKSSTQSCSCFLRSKYRTELSGKTTSHHVVL